MCCSPVWLGPHLAAFVPLSLSIWAVTRGTHQNPCPHWLPGQLKGGAGIEKSCKRAAHKRIAYIVSVIANGSQRPCRRQQCQRHIRGHYLSDAIMTWHMLHPTLTADSYHQFVILHPLLTGLDRRYASGIPLPSTKRKRFLVSFSAVMSIVCPNLETLHSFGHWRQSPPSAQYCDHMQCITCTRIFNNKLVGRSSVLRADNALMEVTTGWTSS